MDVILTHEQADFDALGSLFAAHLLNDKAYAVQPRKMNRNARSFINLYGEDLPFTEARDLPAENIDMVILVDTQALYSIKGSTQQTRVRVIDHHPLRKDLPTHWELQITPLGACTTAFVEEIEEHKITLNPVEATLLLLGIYEDTGSLTYVGTTSHDVRAAAYLLEQGASLRIASDFLNPPLSQEQMEAYDRLLASAENHTINSSRIIVATADLESMIDEISSVAHKLRDLLDPDALILLVKSSEGIRLVARSTSDQINVAELSAHFGGGGHDRAAGALIRADKLHLTGSETDPFQAAYRELMEYLPRFITPPLTVSQIMSRKPQVIAPDTKAAAALVLMQRYGYEGYPVVDEGKVVGLLNRRAVDRALSHKMNLPAASLMDAGSVTVYPGDSIHQLQRLMVSTGWGQVPVVDPDSDEIIGIVTRTDLLHILSEEQNLHRRQNLEARLESALPPARLELLKAVAEKGHDLRQAVYIVGGFVRDLILGRPSADLDIVVEGDAILLAQSLAQEFGGRVISHNRFGTSKWKIGSIRKTLLKRLAVSSQKGENKKSIQAEDLPESLDLISARTEFYEYPTALPTVEHGSIKLDLHRRDFSINTLALRLDGRHYGELYDFWGGLQDLQNGLVRALHSLSFVDDPTRMLRAVRFEQRFGFSIEQRTLELIQEARPMLPKISGQRLKHEFDLIFLEQNAAGMLARLHSLNLLEYIHPDLSWSTELARPFSTVIQNPPDPAWGLPETYANMPVRQVLAYLIWLGRLSSENIESVAKRLYFSNPLKQALLAASRVFGHLHGLASSHPSEIAHLLDSVPRIALYAIWIQTEEEQVCDRIRNYALKWYAVQPVTTGKDLQVAGLPPGPVYASLLDQLRSAWLDGKIHSEEEEQAYLQVLLKKIG